MSIIIRRLGLLVGLIAAIAIASSQIALTVAAPMPKVGISYQTSGGASIGNANYTVVADMVVPAGKYHVTARGTVNNQTGAAVDSVACNAYAGATAVDSGTTSVPLQYAGLATDAAPHPPPAPPPPP